MCENEGESMSFWQQYVFYYCKICSSAIALLDLDKIQTVFIYFLPLALSHTNVWDHIDEQSLR